MSVTIVEPDYVNLANQNDVDLTGAVFGDLLGLMVSGKWGPVENVSNLATIGMLTAEIDRAEAAEANFINVAQIGAINGVAPLDGNGIIPNLYLPPLAITDTFVAVDQAAMLALPAQRGDVAVRTDIAQSFILAGDDPTVFGNWQVLMSPPDSVTSVNGQVGVVQLNAPDVPYASTTGLVSIQVAAALDELHGITNANSAAIATLQGADVNVAYLNVAQTFTQPQSFVGPVAINTGGDAVKGLTIQRTNVTQTANIFEIQSETGGAFAFFDNSGRLAVRSAINSSAALSASPTGPSGIALAIRGLASQSGDLQQWQDSTGAVLAQMNSAGQLRVNNILSTLTAKANLTMNGDTGGIVVQTVADANKGLIVRANSATQSANLFEIQNSDGTVSARYTVASSGAGLALSGGLVVGSQVQTPALAAKLYVNSGTNPNAKFETTSASAVPLVLKGAPSQSSQLTEWRDSADIVLASVNALGQILTPAIRSTASAKAQLLVNADTGGMVLQTQGDANKGFVIRRNSASQSANLQEWQAEDGSFVAGVTGSGVGAFGAASPGGIRLYANAVTSGVIGAVVRAAASQAVNLQEWQDSAGVAQTQVLNDGSLWSNRYAIFRGSTTSFTPLVLRQRAGQTADMLQVQDPNSVALSRIRNDGGFGTYGVSSTFGNLAVPVISSTTQVSGGTLVAGTQYYYAVTATNAAGETVRSSEQTSGVQAAGTPSNTLAWAQVTGATGYKIYRTTVSGTYTNTLLATITNGTTTSYTDTGTAVAAGTPPTAPTGSKLQIQMWANQGGNVFEQLDSAGNPQSYINSGGNHHIGYAVPYGARLNVATVTTTAIGAVIRGVASQSANLQEWQDSTGVAVASILSSGRMSAPQFGSVTTGKTTLNTNFDTGGFGVLTNADTNKGLVIRRNSSTVGANLFEIQDEFGNPKLAVQASMRVVVMGAGAATDSGGGVPALTVYAPSNTAANMVLKAQPSQTANFAEFQSSAAVVTAKVDSAGNVYGNQLRTISSQGIMFQENAGGAIQMSRATAQGATPPATSGKLYFRDGTVSGVKLVAIGPNGVETTILDNL